MAFEIGLLTRAGLLQIDEAGLELATVNVNLLAQNGKYEQILDLLLSIGW